jgi:hypothetical protein
VIRRWGHIAGVPHDFAPTGAGRANESDAPAVHPYQLWTTLRYNFPAGTPETTPGTGMLPGRQRIARAIYAFTLKGAPPSFGRFLVSFSRCKRKSVARDRGW